MSAIWTSFSCFYNIFQEQDIPVSSKIIGESVATSNDQWCINGQDKSIQCCSFSCYKLSYIGWWLCLLYAGLVHVPSYIMFVYKEGNDYCQDFWIYVFEEVTTGNESVS